MSWEGVKRNGKWKVGTKGNGSGWERKPYQSILKFKINQRGMFYS